MDLTILAQPAFGWAFVLIEIFLLYVVFLVIHRVVEKHRGKP